MSDLSRTDRPRIGLALSGGAGRGIAHVGVLRALTENQIPIDAIAGASAGALAGGSFAAGLSIDDLEEMARGFRWRHTQRFSFSRLGLQSNAGLEKFLRAKLPVTRFPISEPDIFVFPSSAAFDESGHELANND